VNVYGKLEVGKNGSFITTPTGTTTVEDYDGLIQIDKDGQMTVQDGGDLQLNGDASSLINNGTLTMKQGLYDTLFATGRLTNNGTFTPLTTATVQRSSGGGGGSSSSSGGGGGAIIVLGIVAAAAIVGGVLAAQKLGLFGEKIGGVVTDDYGNLLNGATVIIQQVIDGELTNVQMTNTDENGRYELIKPEGEYVIISQYVDPATGQTRTAHVYPDPDPDAEQTEEAASSVMANANAG
jgi:hypothetical protein